MPAGFQTREEGGKKYIEGYFAKFGDIYEMWPGLTESIDPHAFDGQLDGDVRALIDHVTHLVLGRTTAGTLELRTDSVGLWGRIEVNEQDTDALNCWWRVQRKDVTQCSFGFDIEEELRTEDALTGSVHYTLTKVKLYEVSVCTFPAYVDTGVEARAADVKAAKRKALDTWKKRLKARMKHGTQTGDPERQD